VGRPSTYASIISTLLARRYVEKEKRTLKPTDVGLKVCDFLVEHLGALFDVKFTAGMEEQLDEIETGAVQWVSMMEKFYKEFLVWMENAKGPQADPGAVRKLLEIAKGIQTWAPATKRGKRTYSDKAFMESIEKQLEEGKGISERQVGALKKLICRYREQLPGLQAAAGELALTEELEAANRPPEPPRQDVLKKLEILKTIQYKEARTVGKKVYDDRVFAESLRAQFESGRSLSPNQIHYLDRLVMKYSDQISNFESRALELGLQATAATEDKESGPLLELLKAVKTWKPPTKRGRREWDDREFYESLSRQYGQHKRLSPKQIASLKKMVKRYAEQVPNYEQVAAQYGIPASAKSRPVAGSEDASG
jgi:hypothetical protein